MPSRRATPGQSTGHLSNTDSTEQADRPGPSVLIWAITARCNYRCTHCYAVRFNRRGELSGAEAKEVIRESAETGAEHLSLYGGEPFLRTDTLSLIEHARNLGLTVSAVSNGSLITDSLAEFLAANSVRMSLSLDGNRETHELVRGGGSWDLVVAAAARFRQQGVPFTTVMALSQRTYPAVPEYLGTAQGLGADAACLIPVMPSGRAKPDMPLTPSQMTAALRQAEEAAERLRFPVRLWCTPFAGAVISSPLISYSSCRQSAELNIAPNGDVFLCDILDDVVANVRDDGVFGAWRKRAQHPLIRELAQPELRRPCLRCPAKETCQGGCYARAQLMSGDVFAPDPLCPRVARHD